MRRQACQALTPRAFAHSKALSTPPPVTRRHPPPPPQIPIIKATLEVRVAGRPVRVHADISYGALNGAAAVEFTVRQVRGAGGGRGERGAG